MVLLEIICPGDHSSFVMLERICQSTGPVVVSCTIGDPTSLVSLEIICQSLGDFTSFVLLQRICQRTGVPTSFVS